MRTHAAPSHQRTREAYFALISRQLTGLNGTRETARAYEPPAASNPRSTNGIRPPWR
jgi:hypothetical protein